MTPQSHTRALKTQGGFPCHAPVRNPTSLSAPVWLGVICVILVFFPHALGEESSAPQVQRTLRVLTYNIHHGEGTDRTLDLERIATVIKSANPDLVALQEVDRVTQRTQGVDQVMRLGELTGLNATFGKAMDFQGGAYGLGILSRWPIVDPQTHALPSGEGIEPRAILEARVMTGENGPEIRFLVTHLDHKADPTQRMNQIAKIHELFPAGKNEYPMLLAGDFNAVPDSTVQKTLLSEWNDSAEGRNFLTCPAGSPRVRIDYILYRPTTRWRVVETRVLDEAVASDHRPVLTMFELQP